MLNPTEGYISPCPSCFSLLALWALPPGNKECLDQITPLHVVTFGAYIFLHLTIFGFLSLVNLAQNDVLQFHPFTCE
jgi:hypothetical protein